MDNLQIEILADFLANHHGWEIEDIEEEFKSFAFDNEIQVSPEKLVNLLREYNKIEKTQIYSGSFKHTDFVKTRLTH